MSRNLDDQIVDILNESKRLELENEKLKKRITRAKGVLSLVTANISGYLMAGEITIPCLDCIDDYHKSVIQILDDAPFEDAQDTLKKMEDLA